jgi:predicted dehydrogenase
MKFGYQCAAKAGRVVFEIIGRSGTLRIYDEKTVEFVDEHGVVHPGEEFTEQIKSSPIFNEFEDVEGEFDHFYKAIRHGEEIIVPPTVAYQHFAFFASALESAKTGKSVDLPSI